MDHSYIDIEVIIRDANQRRSEALGELIAAGWRGLKRLLTGLQYRRPPESPVAATPSAFTGFHYLP